MLSPKSDDENIFLGCDGKDGELGNGDSFIFYLKVEVSSAKE